MNADRVTVYALLPLHPGVPGTPCGPVRPRMPSSNNLKKKQASPSPDARGLLGNPTSKLQGRDHDTTPSVSVFITVPKNCSVKLAICDGSDSQAAVFSTVTRQGLPPHPKNPLLSLHDISRSLSPIIGFPKWSEIQIVETSFLLFWVG